MTASQPGPLARVRDLLATAEAEATTPHDAEAHTTRAAGMLAHYGLDHARLAAVDPEADPLTDRVTDLDNPWATVQAYLLAHLAGVLRCEAIETARPGPGTRLHLFGYASDLARTGILHASLHVQMTRALACQQVPDAASPRAWRRAWMIGWATAATARIRAAETRAENAAEDGTELALALRDRALAVQHRADQAYPCTSTTRETVTSTGYDTGYAHGLPT